MSVDHESMLRTLGKTGRWEGDFEAEEAVDWAVGELARLRASLARADDVVTDLWVAEQRVKDVDAERDQALAEVEELRARLASLRPSGELITQIECGELFDGSTRSRASSPRYLLRKNGVPVEVVVMGMVELEGAGE